MPSLNQPVRNYPLRQVNEPAVYVLGEKQGQKVFAGAGPGPGRVPPGVDHPAAADMGMGYGMPGMSMPGNPQALLAHQNSNMEALEKRAMRDRSASMGPVSHPDHIQFIVLNRMRRDKRDHESRMMTLQVGSQHVCIV